MFMLCAFAMTLRTDEKVREGGSVLQKVSTPAPKPAAPTTTPGVPQPTHDSLPAGQQPAAGTSQPAQTPPPSSSAPATSKPAQQGPATAQPAPAPTKKP
jgi:hypothetical protein